MTDKQQLPTVLPTHNRPANDNAAIDNDTSRLEGVAKVTGAARYSKDVYLPNALFVAFIRCPLGAARLDAVNERAAMALPGVVDVETFADEGKYQGQPVGYVAADSPAALRRALRALEPKWTRQSFDTSIDDVVPNPPELPRDLARAIANAPHSISAIYTTQVQTHSPAESHGSVVDHRGDDATLYASTQGTFASLDGLDDAFGIPLANVEVRCEHVGGGFGSKLRAGKESLYAARVSAKHKRPAYLFLNRAEEHVDAGHRPSSRTHVDVAFDDDGNILAGRIQSYGGVGVGGNGGVTFPSSRYKLGDIEANHQPVRFNACAERPFRAPGRPQGAFCEELLLDEIATAIGADPLDLRIRLANHDDLPDMFRDGARRIGWGNRKPTGSQTSTLRTGYGIGATHWARFPSRADAEVVINPDGSVEARTGTQDIGTGQRTAMAVCAAHAIGIPLDKVSVRIGSSRLPYGPASGGSVTIHNTAPTMVMAAHDARDALFAKLADRIGADDADFTIHDLHILHHNEPVMSWDEACRTLANPAITGRGNRNDAVEKYDKQGHTYGAQFVKLTVDTDTGQIRLDHIVAIQACGRVILRKMAESQIIGGVTQGLSYALYEDRILDANVGAMVNANLEMYKWAGARDVPHIEPVLFTKGQSSPRSLGEPPTIPTAGAIACALYNAIGTPVRALPLTPDKVLAAIAQGGRR